MAASLFAAAELTGSTRRFWRAVGAQALAEGQQVGEPPLAAPVHGAVLHAAAPALLRLQADDVVHVVVHPAVVVRRPKNSRRQACRFKLIFT